MMRFLMLLLWVSMSFTAHAQVTDTLGYDDENYLSGTEVLYESPNGGYAFGNNGYGDKVKAQTYVNEESFVLRQVLLRFGAVEYNSSDPSSAVRISVYDNYGTGITSLGVSDSIAPDSVLASVTIPITALVENDFSVADFTSETVVIYDRFSVGIDLTELAPGDTVGLYSTTDGDAEGSFNAWELTANEVWFTVEDGIYSWDLDVDLAIFPVIDEADPAGLPEFSADEWNIGPNPTKAHARVSLPNGRGHSVEMMNTNGQVIFQRDNVAHKLDVDLSEYPSGFYLIRVMSEDGVGVKRLVKY